MHNFIYLFTNFFNCYLKIAQSVFSVATRSVGTSVTTPKLHASKVGTRSVGTAVTTPSYMHLKLALEV